jgi:flagellar basal body rod protein FlgG
MGQRSIWTSTNNIHKKNTISYKKEQTYFFKSVFIKRTEGSIFLAQKI